MDDSKTEQYSFTWSTDTKYLLCAGYILRCLGDGGEQDPGPQPKRATQWYLVLGIWIIKSSLCNYNIQVTVENFSSLVVETVKNQPAMQETQVWSLGQEDPLEKGMATHSSVLAWRIPQTEEHGGL